ncbi:MAG: AAA family ATPase, partial [Alphaproteobacteria bacterium]|nr:AAA family ATPase [Alphaproteobacteria bacterium]
LFPEIARRVNDFQSNNAVALEDKPIIKLGIGDVTEPLPEAAYTPEASARVYDRIAGRAAALLAAGHAVIADAVYARPDERAAIAAVADRAGAGFDGVWLEAPVPVLADRVTGRSGDASDADAAVVEKQSAYELGPIDWHRVDAGGDADDTADGVWAVLGDDG